MSQASPGPSVAIGVGSDLGDAPPVERIEPERLVEIVRGLAGDEYAGRRVGTPGGEAAAAWLAERLRDIGAIVTTEQFPVTGVRELQTTPILRYDDQPLAHRRDFAEQLTSTELRTPQTGPLVTGEASSWRDCWVAVDSAAPEVVARAVADGALGLLVPRGVDADGWMPKMIAGPPTGALPILSVRGDLHATMKEQLGEVTGSVPMRTVSAFGHNIYGGLAEVGPGGLAVLLTAHYDGVGDDPAKRFPAAADNASGVAVVLDAARVLAATLPAGTGLAVALLDAEEAGARGSAHHAAHVKAGTYVINVDGAAQLGDAAAVEAVGPAEPLLAALDQAGRRIGVPLRAGAMPSDNRRYAAAGLPTVGIGMGMPGYQTPAETPDRVEVETLIIATELVVATVWQLVTLARAGGPTS